MEFNNNKEYSIEEAIKLVRENKKEKFDPSLEIHMKLGIDPKKGEQQIRGAITLPHGTGKSQKVAAFVTADKEKEAKDAGADIVGGEELITEIAQSGKIDFNVAIATPDMMRVLAKAAKVLGPKGLMPSPKNDTVTQDVKKAIQELKKGKISYKNDDTSNLHQAIGKLSFTDEQLIENFNTFIAEIRRRKPASSKGIYIQGVTVCSSMGKGVKVVV